MSSEAANRLYKQEKPPPPHACVNVELDIVGVEKVDVEYVASGRHPNSMR